MNDGADLLRAILASPADDAPRLVYADWLEENGDESRAEFIRVQVILAHLEECHGAVATDEHVKRCGWCRQTRRADVLLSVRVGDWFPGPGRYGRIRVATGMEGYNEHGTPVFGQRETWGWGLPGGRCILAEPERGFIGQVECSADDWCEHGDDLVASHPITTVMLTTTPALRHQSHDGYPNPDGGDLRTTLARLWPGIEFRLPRRLADSGVGGSQYAIPIESWDMTVEEYRIIHGDPSVPPPMGTMAVDDDIEANPPRTPRRNTRRPSWLTPKWPTRPR